MKARLTIDGAGRVVIPRAVRDKLDLETGDTLEIDSAGESITLRPIRETSPLVKEKGVWVYRAGQPLSASVVDQVIGEVRGERQRQSLDGNG